MDLVYTFEDGSEAIAHYGVKGMRWGHRKSNIESYKERRERLAKEEGIVYNRSAHRDYKKYSKYAEKAARAKTASKRQKFINKGTRAGINMTDKIALDNPNNSDLRAHVGAGAAVRQGKKNETKHMIRSSVAIGALAAASSVASVSIPAAYALGAVSLGAVAASTAAYLNTSRKITAYTTNVLTDDKYRMSLRGGN